MNRNLKHVNGVFTKIVGANNQLSEFERFLNDGPIKMTPVLSKMTGTYKNIVTKWKTQFETVSLLEETILHRRLSRITPQKYFLFLEMHQFLLKNLKTVALGKCCLRLQIFSFH